MSKLNNISEAPFTLATTDIIKCQTIAQLPALSDLHEVQWKVKPITSYVPLESMFIANIKDGHGGLVDGGTHLELDVCDDGESV